ncbi:MAG: amidohydrolase family protein, partial [Atopobiaceae bacterium]|nr:amidohydrolase family protein [Atopobiaceae bacterium]
RITAIQPFLASHGMMGDADFAEGLARLYYDLAGAPTPEMLDLLLSITAPEHVLYGSDYPFTNARLALMGKARLEEMLAESPHRDAIMGGNAARLLSRGE